MANVFSNMGVIMFEKYGCNYVRKISEHAPNDIGETKNSNALEYRYTDTLNIERMMQFFISISGDLKASQIDTKLRKDECRGFTNIRDVEVVVKYIGRYLNELK